MEWGKLYANLPDDPRVQAAEDNGGAGFLLIESMCYCTSAETDGFIPHTQVERFGGGPKKKQKVAALVREHIWLPVDGGYHLNPDLWSEERNLSDQAEKKREADRERMRAKRAREAGEKAAQNGSQSRDSRATCRATSDATGSATRPATCSSDSRTLEKRREDLSTAEVVSHLPLRNARPPDDDDKLVSAAVDAFLERTECAISADDARSIAAKVLARASADTPVIHADRYVAAAITREPDPFSLLGDPPPLSEILAAPAPLQVPLCGQCDPRTRMREDAEGRPYHCPECHPNARLEAS